MQPSLPAAENGDGGVVVGPEEVVGRCIYAALAVGWDKDEIMIITNRGMLIRTRVKEVSIIGRNTRGVGLITLERADGKVSGVAHLPRRRRTRSRARTAAATRTRPPEARGLPQWTARQRSR